MPNSRKSRCLGDLNDHERLQDMYRSIVLVNLFNVSCAIILIYIFFRDFQIGVGRFLRNQIKSDGSCQFRALAEQLFETLDSHTRVRREVVKHIKSHPQSYKGFIGAMNFSEYVKNKSNNAVWGDNLTLQAAADFYGVEIVVITSYKDTPTIVVRPKSQKQPDKVIYLSFLAEYHYNSIHLNNTGTASMLLHRKNKNKKKNNKESDKENVKDKKKK